MVLYSKKTTLLSKFDDAEVHHYKYLLPVVFFGAMAKVQGIEGSGMTVRC